MRADETREGMVIDVTPAADLYALDDGQRLDEFEYALVEADAEPAEPVDGTPAVLIFTTHGNYKLPADFDLPFINYDGAPDDMEASA